MKQIIQHQKTGRMEVADLPDPHLREGCVLVANHCSLISAGTERTSVATAKASMLQKARMRPDLVRQVLGNVRRDGLVATMSKVRTRLDSFKELGYSTAGTVLASAVDDFRPGDRVACAGAGYASHADLVVVPRNLVCAVPEGVSLDEAAFTTLGTIALQGVRQADVRLGENVAVIGLGLIGLITVQLLKAAGCRVAGLDVSRSNFDLARKLGCDACFQSSLSCVQKVRQWSRGYGTDAVIITAGTSSNEPLELALQMARRRSAVVVVGAVRMDVPRSPFYEKELELRISCSYGPGRYDPRYEEDGQDYPVGHVRWTENRNMEGFLDLVKMRKVDVRSLTTHTFPVERGLEAYDLITGKAPGRYLGILLQYDAGRKATPHIEFDRPSSGSPSGGMGLGIIGAGNFAQASLLPHIDRTFFDVRSVVNATPVSARSAGEKAGAARASTDPEGVFGDPSIGAVLIATRHDTHAKYVKRAIETGRHVFVEKPLAIDPAELEGIEKALRRAKGRVHLMVGFNRRFSPAIVSIREFMADAQAPLLVNYRVNAGFLPSTHWAQNAAQGGRIVGEVCHFIDTAGYLTASQPISVYARSISGSGQEDVNADTVVIIIGYGNGSIASITYVANGDGALPKEYCEVSGGLGTAVLNNFREVHYFGSGKKVTRRFDGGKGHAEEMAHFGEVCRGTAQPLLSPESIFRTSRVSFGALESLASGLPIGLER